jgi:3-isopropylmalate/(R)-2-methylmalate dehydratase large subunit
MNNNKKTLFDKVWDAHVVETVPDGPQIIYIDKHLIHEVTSPQAFAELESRNLEIFRPEQIVATADHNVPTLIRKSRSVMNCQEIRFSNYRKLYKNILNYLV